jgi:hypothetical protein
LPKFLDELSAEVAGRLVMPAVSVDEQHASLGDLPHAGGGHRLPRQKRRVMLDLGLRAAENITAGIHDVKKRLVAHVQRRVLPPDDAIVDRDLVGVPLQLRHVRHMDAAVHVLAESGVPPAFPGLCMA